MPKPGLRSLSLKTAVSISALTLLGGCGAASESEGFEELGTHTEAATMSMLGADISAMQRTLDLGYKYYDSAGVQKGSPTCGCMCT